MTERRRRRPHAAASARIVVTGLAASTGLGMMTVLAIAARSDGGGTPTTDGVDTPATAANQDAPPTIVIRRYVPVPVDAALRAPATTAAATAPPATARPAGQATTASKGSG